MSGGGASEDSGSVSARAPALVAPTAMQRRNAEAERPTPLAAPRSRLHQAIMVIGVISHQLLDTPRRRTIH
jgi:hypothetical protein